MDEEIIEDSDPPETGQCDFIPGGRTAANALRRKGGLWRKIEFMRPLNGTLDFQIFDNPPLMEEALRCRLNEGNSARLLAFLRSTVEDQANAERKSKREPARSSLLRVQRYRHPNISRTGERRYGRRFESSCPTMAPIIRSISRGRRAHGCMRTLSVRLVVPTRFVVSIGTTSAFFGSPI